MPNVKTVSARMGFVTSVAAMILTAGNASEAVAMHRVHATHFHRLHARAQYVQGASVTELATPTAMRYYGGPKSSMWRGPVQN